MVNPFAMGVNIMLCMWYWVNISSRFSSKQMLQNYKKILLTVECVSLIKWLDGICNQNSPSWLRGLFRKMLRSLIHTELNKVYYYFNKLQKTNQIYDFPYFLLHNSTTINKNEGRIPHCTIFHVICSSTSFRFWWFWIKHSHY